MNDEKVIATAREKLGRVFQYLRALNEHRNPAVRDIDEQPWVLRLRSLPEHPSVHRPAPDEDTDVILTAQRPTLTPAPPPPAILRDWLAPTWTDASQALKVLDSRNEPHPGGTKVVRFDEDPQRVRALQGWRPKRDAWARNEQPALAAAKLFERLYDLHGRIDREAERVELVLGDGILSWKRAEGQIFHPLLLQKVQLTFDPAVPKFSVTDAGAAPELYTAPLRGFEDVDGGVLARCRAELAEGGFLPTGHADTNGFLQRLTHGLSANAEFVEDEAPARNAEPPRMGRDAVLFLRVRNGSFAAMLDGVIEDLAQREDFPVPLLRVVGIESSPPASEEPAEPIETGIEPEDVLLSKPANPEQVQIARRLDAHGCVLVQGPPGTGKTHTIANLVGHLLANQKSVLVTSHTTKALRVLREKVVPALQPLCVSVLENDLDSRNQLKDAVTAIADRLSSSDGHRLEVEAARLERERKKLLSDLHDLRSEMVDARSNEYRELVVGGEGWKPSDAARHVASGREKDSWIPGPVEPAAPCPLSEGQAIELYATNAEVTAAQETELGCPLPSPDELLASHVAEQSFARLAELESPRVNHRRDLWVDETRDDEPADLLRLAERAMRAVEVLDGAAPWSLAVVAAGSDEGEAAVWHSLLDMIASVRRHAAASRELLLTHAPQVAGDAPIAEHLKSAVEIRAHLEAGGGLGAMRLLTRGNWRRLLKEIHVDSGEPHELEHFAAIEAHLRLVLLRGDLVTRWDRQLGTLRAPKAAELGPAPEDGAHQFAVQIRRRLDWMRSEWAPLQSELEACGLRWEVLLGEEPPHLTPNGQLHRLKSAVTGALQAVLQARALRIERARIERVLSRALRKLDNFGGPKSASPTVCELARCIATRDARAYAAAFARLVDLTGRKALLERRRLLLARVEPVAPTWAAALRNRRKPHDGASPPGEAAAAWKWRQLEQELERRAKVDIAELQAKTEATSRELRRVTGELIESRAWAAQVRRTSLTQQQALTGWLAIMRRIGAGTGKRVPQLRAQAVKQMKTCRDAVPVWVMPLSRVVENFDALSRFDVVIVDEASQSDVLALVAMYLGKQVVVVGDDEQVSPSAVGQNLGVVQNLINEHLTGIPNAVLYDGKTSVYDLANMSFGGMVCLTEHFRCVPDIIEFSNQLSYQGRIKPLREAGTSTLSPALVLHRVQGHSNEKVNPVEAMAVATLVAAAIEAPEYEGKSIGVISLVGDDQAYEIESLLHAHLHPSDLQRHGILCGNAAQFQGDERDVIFLSMVDGPQGGPLRSRTEQQFKQRFNVAVSRARDQLWVVHSLDAETDLKPLDLRRRLIEHCRAPFGIAGTLKTAEHRVESPFEQGVLERLVRAGFRVTPQWKVGHYRIDLVVEGGGKRLAIECDGDRYHPIEKIPEDLARQAILERLGWRFARIRGSSFFRDPEKAMQPVFARLEQLGIPAEGSSPPPETKESELQSRIVRRAAEIEREWAAEAAEDVTEDASEPDSPSETPTPGGNWSRRWAGQYWHNPKFAPEPPQREPATKEAPTESKSSEVPEGSSRLDGPPRDVRAAANDTKERARPENLGAIIAPSAARAAHVIKPGKSAGLVREAIQAGIDARGLRCSKCGQPQKVDLRDKWPVVICQSPSCGQKQQIDLAILVKAIADMPAACDCGHAMHVREYFGSTFLACSGYPKHKRTISWRDL